MLNKINLISLVIKWRLAIFIITLLVLPIDQAIKSLANFDGLKYIAIAEEGYGTPSTFYSYNLFPLYPLIVHYFSSLFDYFYSSLFVSHLFALSAIFMLYKLATIDFTPEKSKKVVLLLLLFPASFFLITAYSESLFLTLSLSALYFARKQYFFISAVFAALATYTRAAGLILWVCLIIEYLSNHKSLIKALWDRRSLSMLIPPLGILYYLRYLEINTSDFLKFLPSLPTKFVFIHQVFIRYSKMIVFVDHSSSLFWVVLTELALSLFCLYLLIVSFKTARLSYWVYFLMAFFIPSLWGSFSGITRFIFICGPFFIILTNWLDTQKPLTQKIYLYASMAFLAVNLILFTRGIFVG